MAFGRQLYHQLNPPRLVRNPHFLAPLLTITRGCPPEDAGCRLFLPRILSSGVAVQLLAQGNLPAPVRVKVKDESKTNMDATQIQTYKITLPPGAYTGWHQHGGPHLIVVASGTLTDYEGDDPTCTGVSYPAGSAILDAGFDTHFVRNEGSADVVTYVTQLLPDGGIFRIDVPAPGNCSF